MENISESSSVNMERRWETHMLFFPMLRMGLVLSED